MIRASLLPLVEETIEAGIVAAGEAAFSFRHPLLGRAVNEMIPADRSALHRQFGEILLHRGDSAVAAARHLLEAASTGDRVSLASLDGAAAELLPAAPQTAARLALRALDLTQPDDPAVLDRSAAAAEALAAAGRPEPAARIAAQGLAQPVPPVTEARLRCALSVVLSAGGHDERARSEAAAALAQPGLQAGLRDDAIAARLQALRGPADQDARQLAAGVLSQPGRHGSQAVTAALVIRALSDWDQGQVGSALEGLSEAARLGRAVSADARHVQPLLALGASLADLGRYGEAEKVIQAIDPEPLQGIPAHVVLAILTARLSLARGDVGQAASAANAAVAAAGPARGHASLGHCLLALIAVRQGDLAAAAHHLASQPGPVPYLAASYARSAASMTHAQLAAANTSPGRRHQPHPRHLRGPAAPAGDPARPAGDTRLAGAHRAGRGRTGPGHRGGPRRQRAGRRQPGCSRGHRRRDAPAWGCSTTTLPSWLTRPRSTPTCGRRLPPPKTWASCWPRRPARTRPSSS